MSVVDHKWIRCSNGSTPPLAVICGTDSDGDIIFVGRADYKGDLLPAKVIPNKGTAYVSFGGQELELGEYEVLSGLYYEWCADANGQVPATAVKVGATADGDILYAGRGTYEGSLTMGKIHPSHGCLYIPYGGAEIKLTNYEVLTQPEKWLDATASSIPEGAVEGGQDADGDIIYVGRVSFNGDLMPAKVIPSKGGAYIGFAGEEQKMEDFQVLAGAGFVWTSSSNGSIIPRAIPAGNTSDGETLYIGRAVYNGSTTVGKIHPSHGCLYLPFAGKEIKLEDYEVLVRI